MIRLGTLATVVTGAVMVVNLSAAAQEQAAAPAAEQTVDSAVQPTAEPPAPAAVAPPEAPAEEAAAPVEEAEAEEAPPVEEVPAAPPVAQFLDINDAVPGRFFDAKATAAGAAAAEPSNTLKIEFHAGIDWTTWKNTEFRASTESFSYAAAMDTISFRIEAPEGFYISRVTYSQAGRGSILRTGKAVGTAQWVVGAFAAPLAQFGTTPTLKGEADLTGLGMTSVPVSITNGLFAFATPSLGSAIVEVNSAEVQVFLEPLTNP